MKTVVAFCHGSFIRAVSREYLSYHKLSLKNIILFGAPGAKASTMVLNHPALKCSTCQCTHAYISCVCLKMLIILQTQELYGRQRGGAGCYSRTQPFTNDKKLKDIYYNDKRNVNFIRCNNSANTIVVHQEEPHF